ncbi:MAG: NTP transferase domain-containing protein [Nitrospirae bacterium]|nr:NTP transferase domain-containing protein [Nitrospirota bacterium]
MARNNDKTVALIPARLTSTRLPEKHLKKIGPKSLISWVIHQLKRSKEIDEIAICAPDEPESEKLRPIAEAEGVALFIYKGSTGDVVGRLTKAAEVFRAEICVLASGDCPLLSPGTIDSMVRLLKDDPTAGHVGFTPVKEKLPIHEGIVISRRWLWERAEKLSDTPALREHHFPVFLRAVYPEKFDDVKVVCFRDDDCFYSIRHRISVDTPADLRFMNALYGELKDASAEFTLENAINLLRRKKDITKINARVYQKAFGETSSGVLFISESGGCEGVIYSLEIADALVHHHGIGAKFLVYGKEALSIATERGYNAFTGNGYDSHSYSALIVDISTSENIDIAALGANTRVVLICRHSNTEMIEKIAASSALTIVPSLLYNGKRHGNLKWGKEYVIVRESVKKVKKAATKKKDTIAVYTAGNEFLGRLRDERLPEFEPEFKTVRADICDRGFPKALAQSRLYLCPLDISAYEALYLDSVPVLIPLTGDDKAGIESFYRLTKDLKSEDIDTGADTIAREIADLIKTDIIKK